MNTRNKKTAPLSGNPTNGAVLTALLAAALYGISFPASKFLLSEIAPTMMAALLYLGAGAGMLAVRFARKLHGNEPKEASLSKQDLPYILGMIVLDIAAPIFLMLGLLSTTASNASLLNNFEITATALIALFVFKEAVSRQMWLAIALITLAGVLVSIDDFENIRFSAGSLLVIAACLCWGLENNCTRMLSLKDPLQIVVIKGFGAGTGALAITIAIREMSGSVPYVLLALLTGFVAYGLSLFFYIRAQRRIGAAKTSAYYAAAPFIGVLLSWILLRETLSPSFAVALVIMLLGAGLAAFENHAHTHVHSAVTHEHKHSHNDMHHTHLHEPEVTGEHSHSHTHELTEHGHAHSSDLHHMHRHNKHLV